MKIVVTLPAYNEEKNIGKVIQDIVSVMKEHRYKYNVLVVDDGSRDNTSEVAKKNKAVVYSHPKNYGLAETFKTEIKKSLELKADVIVHIDADGQYLAREIPRLIQPIIKKEADLVLGSRFLGKIEYMSITKKMGNKAFSRVISRIINFKVSDCQTGFRVFTRDVAEKIMITSTYTYTQEQVIRAVRNKFKVKEVPVYFGIRYGKSRLMKNSVDYALKAWINLFRIYRDYEPLKFFGFIGGALFFVGFLIGLWFIYLHFTTGITGHSGLMMLMFLLILISIQIISFGFLADMFKK